jgi:hypothetical protein
LSVGHRDSLGHVVRIVAALLARLEPQPGAVAVGILLPHGIGQFSERLCKLAVVRLTIEGRVVLGQTKFERDAPNINGTVDEDGTFGGTIGFQPLRGQFIRDEFEGTFKSFDCERKALLRRRR